MARSELAVIPLPPNLRSGATGGAMRPMRMRVLVAALGAALLATSCDSTRGRRHGACDACKICVGGTRIEPCSEVRVKNCLAAVLDDVRSLGLRVRNVTLTTGQGESLALEPDGDLELVVADRTPHELAKAHRRSQLLVELVRSLHQQGLRAARESLKHAG